MVTESAKDTEIPRRAVLRAFVGTSAATGLGSLYHLGEVSGTDYVKIPTVRGGENNKLIRSETVPEDWFEHAREIRKVLANNREDLLSTNGVISIGLSRSDEVYAGMHGSDIHAEVAETGVDGKLPKELGGFDVIVEEAEEIAKRYSSPDVSINNSNACHNDKQYSPIQGGSVVSSEEYWGTACIKVSKDNTNYMLTAAHTFADDTFSDECYTGVEGTTCYQPYPSENDSEMGTIEEYIAGTDVALINSNNTSRGLSNGVDLAEDGLAYAAGYYTLSGIEYLKSESIGVGGVGGTTGNTEGEVFRTQGTRSSCTDFRGEEVTILPGYSATGDSGGPWYTLDIDNPVSPNIFLIGMLSEGDNNTGEKVCGDTELKSVSRVYPMYDLAKNEGYVIGGGDTISWEVWEAVASQKHPMHELTPEDLDAVLDDVPTWIDSVYVDGEDTQALVDLVETVEVYDQGDGLELKDVERAIDHRQDEKITLAQLGEVIEAYNDSTAAKQELRSLLRESGIDPEIFDSEL